MEEEDDDDDDLRGIEEYKPEMTRKRRERRKKIYNSIHSCQEKDSDFMVYTLSMISGDSKREARIRGIKDRAAALGKSVGPNKTKKTTTTAAAPVHCFNQRTKLPSCSQYQLQGTRHLRTIASSTA